MAINNAECLCLVSVVLSVVTSPIMLSVVILSVVESLLQLWPVENKILKDKRLVWAIYH